MTLTVASDKTALRALASGLVSNLGAILGDITSRTASTTSTASDGGSVVKGGLFSGDSTIRFLQQNLLAQASAPVNGVSPSDVGIVIGKDGTFSFDQEKFDAALAADPSRVQSIVSTVAERLAGTAKSASDSSTGSLTLSIQSQQALVKDLGERITDWDDRLAMRRTSLERVYAALETSMANLQSQSSYLTSQINALTSSKSS